MDGCADFDCNTFAILLDAARRTRVCLHPFSQRLGIGEAQAYGIQKAGLKLRYDRGERAIGYKLGFTSQAMRRQMGIQSANFGVLTDAMLVDPNLGLDKAPLTHPRAEPEVALKLAHEIGWPVNRGTVEGAIEACAVAIEIVDSRFHDYRFALNDNSADNSSAAAFILGEWRNWPAKLDGLEVALTLDGQVREKGDTSAALGHPVDALMEAVRLAHEQNNCLASGTIVLTGGLTSAHYIDGYRSVGAYIEGLGEVHCAIR
jgi:2-oxo-3-hexenedioate decarboxylase